MLSVYLLMVEVEGVCLPRFLYQQQGLLQKLKSFAETWMTSFESW